MGSTASHFHLITAAGASKAKLQVQPAQSVGYAAAKALVGKPPGLYNVVMSSVSAHELRSNLTLNRTTNGRAPGPAWRYAVHFRQSGPGALPLAAG